MRRSAVARAANLIIDHSGSGKPLGWLPAPHRKSCHFGANPGTPRGSTRRPPATKRFHAAKDEKGRNIYRLVVRGKTNERHAIVRAVAAKQIDKYLTKRREGDPDGLLFVMPDGSAIITLIDQLNAALKEVRIERSSFGEKYTVYSLRHLYAVNVLRNGVGVFEVARNMGASAQMIQEDYGKQATAAVFATRLGD